MSCCQVIYSHYHYITDTDTPSLKEFCDELGTIHYKWFKFGISLDVPYDVLKGFEGEKDPLAAVITYWRAGNTVVSVSWKSIADALKSNQEGGLARKIEIKYCSGKSNIHGKFSIILKVMVLGRLAPSS